MSTSPISPSLIQATVEDLRHHAPFSEMASMHVEWMALRLKLAYYPAGAVVRLGEHALGPEAAAVRALLAEARSDAVMEPGNSGFAAQSLKTMTMHAPPCRLSGPPTSGEMRQ